VRDRATAVWLGLLALGVRAFAIVRYRIDSDEPQHLHIAWAWSEGQLAYRDFFDNHMPLFHVIAAPFVRLAGERPDILMIGRLLMVPLAAALLLLTWRIASSVTDRRTALWCVLAVSLTPPLLLKGVEFRNDNLCVVLCVAAVALVMNAQLFLAALLLGLAFCASLKAAVFAAALMMALVANGEASRRVFLPVTAGFMLPVAAMSGFFAWKNTLRELIFCTFEYNRMFPANPVRAHAGALAFIPMVIAVYSLIRRFMEKREMRLIVLTCGFFLALLVCFWPLITTRDFLPILPLAVIALVALTAARMPRLVPAIPALFVVWTIAYGALWRTPDPYYERLIAQTLATTRSNDYILDLKGETVFRRRSSYFVVEHVARELFASGKLHDTFATDMMRTHCRVAIANIDWFPSRSRAWLSKSTLVVGELRAVRYLESRRER
jgi:hypothetical protein